VEEIGRAGSSLLAEGIVRLRGGRVKREPGYDGEYGVIRLFEDGELDRLAGGLLFDSPIARRTVGFHAAAANTPARQGAPPRWSEPEGGLFPATAQVPPVACAPPSPSVVAKVPTGNDLGMFPPSLRGRVREGGLFHEESVAYDSSGPKEEVRARVRNILATL